MSFRKTAGRQGMDAVVFYSSALCLGEDPTGLIEQHGVVELVGGAHWRVDFDRGDLKISNLGQISKFEISGMLCLQCLLHTSPDTAIRVAGPD